MGSERLKLALVGCRRREPVFCFRFWFLEFPFRHIEMCIEFFKDTFQQNFKSPYYSSLFTSFLHTLLFPCLWGSSFDLRCDVIGRLLGSRRGSAVYLCERKRDGPDFPNCMVWWYERVAKIVSFWANLWGYLTLPPRQVQKMMALLVGFFFCKEHWYPQRFASPNDSLQACP